MERNKVAVDDDGRQERAWDVRDEAPGERAREDRGRWTCTRAHRVERRPLEGFAGCYSRFSREVEVEVEAGGSGFRAGERPTWAFPR